MRIPIWHCGPSCTCPPPCLSVPGEEAHYIDFAPLQMTDRDWTWRPDPIPPWEARMVTGYFTGKSHRRDLSGCWRGQPSCDLTEPSWELWEFRALAAVPAPSLSGLSQPWEMLDEASMPRILASDPSALDWPAPLDSARPWLVVVASFPSSDPVSRKQAEKMASALRSEGWPEAEVIDSRSTHLFDCCYLVVSLGRWPTREAAEAAKHRLSPRRDASVRRAL